MEVQFKIKPKGGVAETVTAELVDVIAWEEKYQRPSTELGGDNIFAWGLGCLACWKKLMQLMRRGASLKSLIEL